MPMRAPRAIVRIMKNLLLCATALFFLIPGGHTQRSMSNIPRNRPSRYLGFDRNAYPGDANLAAMRKTFSYTGFWLNAPPGSMATTWTGKRAILRSAGFGFLVSFNGRSYAELARSGNPEKMGRSDAAVALHTARREGFPRETVIFLDQEEGGRLLPEQRAYLYAWVDAVNTAGFRAGVYCSAMPFVEGDGKKVITAEDIHNHAGQREIVYWVYNDACGPSLGCSISGTPPSPRASGVPFAAVWQYAQSPCRPNVAAACRQTYNPDGNCYPPGFRIELQMHVDLDTATSKDPSHGRGD